MLELGPYGSMRGARSNARPYRDPRSFAAELFSASADFCPLLVQEPTNYRNAANAAWCH
jgi:hypothetical protein